MVPREVQKRKNLESNGSSTLDLDLSLGLKAWPDQINGDDGVIESNLSLSLNSLSSNPLSDKITRFKEMEKEEEIETIRTKKTTSTLDLTL